MTSLVYLVVLASMLAALILLLGSAGNIWTMGLAGILIASLLYLAVKLETARRRLSELDRLQHAYDQLDQQAKMIIRTDLELHRTQEELDRRLASLMSLHQLGQQLQVSLHPDEVFNKLDARLVTNFGFSKGLFGLYPPEGLIEWRALVGTSSAAAEELKNHLAGSPLLKKIITAARPQTLQLSSSAEATQRKLLELLEVSVAVVAGIRPHAGPPGLLLLGRMGGVTNPKADEELVAILTNQLTTAVENSALYEETWKSRQDLERKVLERTRELAEANTGLVRLNKAKTDFVSAVSHELRTPLAAIKGYAALLGSGQFGPLTPPQTERVAKIEKHADLLTQFINNLLDIARIESGRITMERRAVPIEELFSAVHEVIQPQLDAKHIRYKADHNGVTELIGDSQHLQRMLVNLLSNAIKYTSEQGRIQLEIRQEGTSILVSVSDSGCGMAEEDLQKLFQEFYRANDPINQQIRGTGLGLVLVKRIVEAHQGRVWVNSEKGKGSTFFVSLPAHPEQNTTEADTATGAG